MTATSDQGQPLSISAGFSVPMAAEVFRCYAGWCTKLEGTAGPVATPDVLHYTRREPVGVAALITPWNFPLMIAAWKLAPALAAGNCVVLKPSELTPLTTIRLARFCVDAGVPTGVVNLLTGDGDLGQALAAFVWTRDLATAHRTAAAIRAGTVWVNMLPILDVAAPWGGFKASGWGREFSHQALDAFTETKSIFVGLS